jgi:hypothetical protein
MTPAPGDARARLKKKEEEEQEAITNNKSPSFF